MAVKACLNGGRTPDQHAAVPQTPDELARDAVAARRAGAFAVHLHPRDGDGRQTMAARECDAAVAAIRSAAPGLPIGLSTAEAIDPDPFARAAAVSRWRTPPDFVSVNLGEIGWIGVIRAALHAGIAIEAGLATPQEAREFTAGAFVHRVLRVLVEVQGGAEDAREVAALVPEGVPQLWHGYDRLTWEVLEAGAEAGHDVRVGLEDVLTLPDGRLATDNAELVTAAVQLTSALPEADQEGDDR